MYELNSSFPFHIVKETLDGDIPEHQHIYSVEMSFVIHGEALHKVGKNSRKIERGEVIIILKPTSHSRIHMKNHLRYTIQFDLEKSLLLNNEINHFPGFHSLFFIEPTYLQEKFYTSGFTLNEEQLNYSITMFDIMYEAYNLKYNGYKTIIKTHLSALLAYISLCYNPTPESIPSKLYKIAETASYIEMNYAKKINIKELASIACLSERQYNRIFKSVYGMSPNVYLIQVRLYKSCRFLEDPYLTIRYISNICGFFDDAYFIKQFKRHFNMTPGEYRKNLINNPNIYS